MRAVTVGHRKTSAVARWIGLLATSCLFTFGCGGPIEEGATGNTPEASLASVPSTLPKPAPEAVPSQTKAIEEAAAVGCVSSSDNPQADSSPDPIPAHPRCGSMSLAFHHMGAPSGTPTDDMGDSMQQSTSR